MPTSATTIQPVSTSEFVTFYGQIFCTLVDQHDISLLRLYVYPKTIFYEISTDKIEAPKTFKIVEIDQHSGVVTEYSDETIKWFVDAASCRFVSEYSFQQLVSILADPSHADMTQHYDLIGKIFQNCFVLTGIQIYLKSLQATQGIFDDATMRWLIKLCKPPRLISLNQDIVQRYLHLVDNHNKDAFIRFFSH